MEEGFKVPEFPVKTTKPEEKQTETAKSISDATKVEIPYKIPKWSGATPSQPYSLEVLKLGVIVDRVENLQSKPFWIFGRLTGVDLVAAHPTISRYHAVLQYKESEEPEETEEVNEEISQQKVEAGWFIFDLDSTHGTFLNKMRVKPRTYVRVKVGHQLKFGNSTRNYILQGPSEDEEEASELTITETKELRKQREAELLQKHLEDKLERERKEKEKEEAGITWGMSEDAEEEPDLTENPFAQTNNEELFLDDPKKTLRGFFEREGYELEYKCDELSPGVFICRVELPVDDEYGKSIVCEVQYKGKKKECVVQCALEACRILDRHGVLRQANHEPRRSRKVENSDDSDDDNFFDRTGDVEKKRLKKAGQVSNEALTYDQLVAQEAEILDKITTKEHKLELMVQMEKRQKAQNDDDLDEFMTNLSSLDHKVDKFAISSMKTELQQLRIEHQKIQKLVNIAKPSIALPPIASTKPKLPLFGKRNALGRNFGVKKQIVPAEVKKAEDFKVEEDEEEIEAEKIPEIPVVKEENITKVEEKETEEPAEKKPRLESLPETTPIVKVVQTPEPSTASQESTEKKKKNRVRIRNRLRENIDMNDDEEYIDEEKVSTWVAPADQTGDGTTHLNQKYGY